MRSVKRASSGKESGMSMRPTSLDLSLSRIEELAKREHQTDLTAGSETRYALHEICIVFHLVVYLDKVSNIMCVD